MGYDQGQDVFPFGSSEVSNMALTPFTEPLPDCSRSGARQPTSMFADLRAMIGLNGLVQPRSRFGLPIGSVLDLAALVRRQRSSLGLTQAELAERAGVGRRFVSELERGKKTVQLEEVLKVLTASELELVGQKQQF